MLKSYLSAALVVLWGGVLFGNAGVFRGSGQTPTLEKSAEIQMVEELVEMRPRRGDYPVDFSCRNLDKMDFRCRFLLRNLTDKRVELTVGFPVSTEVVSIRKPEELDQAKLVAQFNFVAGTRERTFPVRFAPWEKKRKFSNIFLWEMTFEPKQEIELFVSYTMDGYLGLWSTFRDAEAVEKNQPFYHKYSQFVDMAMGESQFYVTGTGSCWAGKIEKAVFRYYPTDFEEYLRKRGMSEKTDEERARRPAGIRKHTDDYGYRCSGNLRFLRNWDPAPDQWKFVPGEKNRRHNSYFELTCAPFTPKIGDRIAIGYVFPFLPENREDFEALCVTVEEHLKSRSRLRAKMLADPEIRKKNPKLYNFWSKSPDILYTPEIRKDLADLVLEFWGVETKNPNLRELLRKMIWYPVENPPEMDEAYRDFLLDISRGGGETK